MKRLCGLEAPHRQQQQQEEEEESSPPGLSHTSIRGQKGALETNYLLADERKLYIETKR